MKEQICAADSIKTVSMFQGFIISGFRFSSFSFGLWSSVPHKRDLHLQSLVYGLRFSAFGLQSSVFRLFPLTHQKPRRILQASNLEHQVSKIITGNS